MADNAKTTGAAVEAHFQFLMWLIPTVEKFPRSHLARANGVDNPNHRTADGQAPAVQKNVRSQAGVFNPGPMVHGRE